MKQAPRNHDEPTEVCKGQHTCTSPLCSAVITCPGRRGGKENGEVHEGSSGGGRRDPLLGGAWLAAASAAKVPLVGFQEVVEQD